MDYDRNDALLHWLFRQTQGDAWFRPNEDNISSGVALRISDVNCDPPEFRVFPYENPTLEPFEAAVVALNPAVAVKVRSAAVHAALAAALPDDTFIYLDANTRIQILDTMLALPAADKEQCAAFIRDERVLVIWSDALDRIIPACADFEDRLIKLLWRAQPQPHPLSNSNSVSHSPNHSTSHSHTHGSFTSARSSVEVLAPIHSKPTVPTKPRHSLAYSTPSPSPSTSELATSLRNGKGKGKTLAQGTPTPTRAHTKAKITPTWYGRRLGVTHVGVPNTEEADEIDRAEKERTYDMDADSDLDATDPRRDERNTALLAPVYNGIAAGFALVFIGNGIKILLQEWTLDGTACVPPFSLSSVIKPKIGPIEQYHVNSKYYSAIKPRAGFDETTLPLPHVTIQMPVYKESLGSVLAPSILSLKRAMQTYARQGGTSALFINDDGLRLLPSSDRAERLAFYALHNVGWVARPGEGDLGAVGDSEGEGDARENTEGEVGRVRDEDVDVEKGEAEEKEKENGRSGEGAAFPFMRAGRFKKASNMNYGLALSLKLERHLARLIAEQQEEQEREREQQDAKDAEAQGSTTRDDNSDPMSTPSPLTRSRSTPNLALLGAPNSNSSASSRLRATPSQVQLNPGSAGVGASLEDQALALAVEETWRESRGGRHRPWAGNGRAARMGEIVLLVDSDTVVPEDCLRDAAREMRECPNVAIIQHESDVMQVAHHYFENGIAYFTRRINRCISMGAFHSSSNIPYPSSPTHLPPLPAACANGEVAPFVGHNAFLRWRALQDAAFIDPADGKEKIWSETNVSEDFDMALRLMARGYIIRWATYSEGGFKEGVSLSVDDELNRWQKYSYGCSELLFNPFIEWFRRGPFARQIHRFMWSSAPLHYKVSMMAYMFSYYGIAASVTISIINYVLLGFQFGVDGFYMHSFEIWLATTVVFFGSGTVGYSLLQYRLGHKQLIPAFLENLMWIPFFFFFFGGLSIPVSQAILAHMFSYNISWSATIKEVQRSNFFKEIPKIAKRFWFPMVVSFVLIVGMIICATGLVPLEWRVDGGGGWAVIFPVSKKSNF
ncbi:hypothetical protein D9615_005482 [Tricholomella constricta]|uniref:Glycosyltransferase 2-like domain-containing protein n=1 Tax=Tricholomella constricta TaxID=117010 RepID=A0A8H5HE80_9AGAR|nr:hypothetical protein D9615_005482 [Tricholomella constricta]